MFDELLLRDTMNIIRYVTKLKMNSRIRFFFSKSETLLNEAYQRSYCCDMEKM